MIELRQSTGVTVPIGPFLDYLDGNTLESGFTLSAADIRLSKNGGNFAAKTEASNSSYDESGQYACVLDATDTGTLGHLRLFCHESGGLYVMHDYMVVTANYWDSKYSTDKLQVDVTQILNHTLTQTGTQLADGFQTFFDVASQTYTSGTALADFKATGFSTHTAANVYTAFGTGGNLTTCATATGFNTVEPDPAGTVDSAHTTTDAKIDTLLRDILISTTIATLASQTSFTLTAGSADDSAYVGCMAIITDVSTAAQKAIGLVSAYTGATKTITLKADPGIFTMAATDVIHILPVPKQLPAGIADGAGGLAISDAGGLDMDNDAANALIAYNLDHLAKTAVADNDDMTTEVVDGTVLSNLLAGGDTSAFLSSTDGMQLIRDAIRSVVSLTVSSTTVGEAPEVNMVWYQNAAFSEDITCSTDQTGYTHALYAYDPSAPGTLLFTIPTGNIAVSTTTLTVAQDDTNTATARVVNYYLWDTSNDLVVARGAIDIQATPAP